MRTSRNCMIERAEGLKVAALQRRNKGGSGVRLIRLSQMGPDRRTPAQVHRNRIDVLATTAVIIALGLWRTVASGGSPQPIQPPPAMKEATAELPQRGKTGFGG